jgi:hypothetical protein
MKSKLFKILSVIVIVATLASALAAQVSAYVSGVTVTTTTAGNVISTTGNYSIYFTLSSQLLGSKSDTVTVAFPVGFIVAAPTATLAASSGWVTLPGAVTASSVAANLTATPIWSYSATNLTVTVTFPAGDYIGATAQVLINIMGGVTNPSKAGNYTLAVATSAETTQVTSSAFTIVNPTPTTTQPTTTTIGSSAPTFPLNGATGVPVSGVTFTWSLVAAPTGSTITYQFALAQASANTPANEFAILDYSDNIITNAEPNQETLQYNTAYWWEVRAVTISSTGAVTATGPWTVSMFTTRALPTTTTVVPTTIVSSVTTVVTTNVTSPVTTNTLTQQTTTTIESPVNSQIFGVPVSSPTMTTPLTSVVITSAIVNSPVTTSEVTTPTSHSVFFSFWSYFWVTIGIIAVILVINLGRIHFRRKRRAQAEIERLKAEIIDEINRALKQ